MRGGRRPGTRTTVEGITYRSKFEASVAVDLSDRGIEAAYESMRIDYDMPRIYVPDFILPNGVIVECKGYFPPEDRAKMMEVKRNNPDLDIRILFQRDSKLGTGPKPKTCLKDIMFM